MGGDGMGGGGGMGGGMGGGGMGGGGMGGGMGDGMSGGMGGAAVELARLFLAAQTRFQNLREKGLPAKRGLYGVGKQICSWQAWPASSPAAPW